MPDQPAPSYDFNGHDDAHKKKNACALIVVGKNLGKGTTIKETEHKRMHERRARSNDVTHGYTKSCGKAMKDFLPEEVDHQHGSAAPEPVSDDEAAKTLYELGRLSRQHNKLQVATSLFRRALESLEGQVRKLGGSHDTKAGFRARHRSYYQDQIEVQLELNQAVAAFRTLERSRAQSFLAQLAERDLGFAGDLSEELEHERRRANAAHSHSVNRP